MDQQLADQQQDVGDKTLLQQQTGSREARVARERAVVLRVYNYFRIVLAFALLILFFEWPQQSFVGTLEPRLFQLIILTYLAFNVATGIGALVDNEGRFSDSSIISAIVILDIFFLSALLFTSGGIDSGLGYLLVFSIAFGSVTLGGQISLVFSAIAVVNCISTELYLQNTGAVSGSQHFFEVAMLGASFFAVNFFFRYVSRLVEEREQEVVSLEALDSMHRLAEQSRQQLEIANDRFNALLKSTSDGVLVVDLQGLIIFANRRAGELLFMEVDQLIGADIQSFMIPDEDPEDERPQKVLQVLGIPAKQQWDPNRWKARDQEPFVVSYSAEPTGDDSGEFNGAVVLFRNITSQWENEEKLQYLANYDELTGLANRTNFREVLVNTIARTARTDRNLAMLVVDTDHFTVINERLGEEIGDTMLKTIADRLRGCVRDGDLVARLHGDQFAVMLVDLDFAENAAIVADKMNRVMIEPINVDGNEVDISVSIGIAVGSDHVDADDLMRAAIAAVANSKDQGRNTFRFFQADMQAKADEKKKIQIMLRNAAENNEFTLMYQPIIAVREGRIYSSEALIRWNPANSEPIRPDIFIPIAEESGQINGIGSWVLQTVSNQVKEWNDFLGNYPSIAINVSSKQLRDNEFRSQFEDAVKTFSIPVDVVEMELTETGVMEDPDTSLRELIMLRELGVKISIDDFGTGYSSLDYLRRLPLDILKIDQSFTWGIGESDNDEEIVRVMIRMAHAMGLKVICEGVETREQLNFLQKHNCDLVQGYYFSKPRSVEDLTDLLVAERNGSVNIMDGAEGMLLQ